MPTTRFTDDSALIEACARNDASAWRELLKRYSRLISISIRVRLARYDIRLPLQDLEDIRQNVLAKISTGGRLNAVRNRRNISHWLAVVSSNEAIEFLRRKGAVNPPGAVSIHGDKDGCALAEFIPAPCRRLEDDGWEKEILDKLNKAIRSLPPKEALIAKLRFVHDKKYDEIADICRLPAGTVSSYVKRAAEKLKAGLRNMQ